MYERHTVRLATAEDYSRWLTDHFVLLDVTDSPAVLTGPVIDYGNVLACHPLDDGLYKLTQANGLTPREGALDFDPDEGFRRLESASWWPAMPSEWSVAEHPGKAMLWAAEGCPALVGETTWTALRRHHENIEAWWTEDIGGAGTFRFAAGGKIVAYAAGIIIPEGQSEIAHVIAERLDFSTSN